jgi:hypothetical protein
VDLELTGDCAENRADEDDQPFVVLEIGRMMASNCSLSS